MSDTNKGFTVIPFVGVKCGCGEMMEEEESMDCESVRMICKCGNKTQWEELPQ